MFRRFIETIKELVLLFFLIAVGSALIDYARITGGEVPLFCLKNYDEKTKIESYRGIFYQASRKVSVSPEEDLVDSSEIKYYALTKEINVPTKFKNEEFKYTLNTVVSDYCGNAMLYYADQETKLYTYCLDSVRLKEAGKSDDSELSEYLKKDSSLMEDIVSNVPFRGLYSDDETLMFRTEDDSFVNNGLAIYRCHKPGINDIYIGPVDMKMQGDFCGSKDDDSDYLWYVEEVESITPFEGVEVIYEDSEYRYEIVNKNIDDIYWVMPAVRGNEEKRIPIKNIISSKQYSIDKLMERGLTVNIVKKENNE